MTKSFFEIIKGNLEAAIERNDRFLWNMSIDDTRKALEGKHLTESEAIELQKIIANRDKPSEDVARPQEVEQELVACLLDDPNCENCSA